MLVKEAASDNVRRKALVRWNLGSVSNRIVEAKVRLNLASSSTNVIENCAAVADNNWNETTVNWNNQPAAQAPFISWFAYTNSPTVEFSVTREVQEAMAVDGLLTLQIFSAKVSDNEPPNTVKS
ncbi:MAG: DNRLRE domain-containing protein [Chloroflexi bacterium]|nr:DNRLRE domain-containing protein [Chloroflexota bacterium]